VTVPISEMPSVWALVIFVDTLKLAIPTLPMPKNGGRPTGRRGRALRLVAP
jgi:hypothetical protein